MAGKDETMQRPRRGRGIKAMSVTKLRMLATVAAGGPGGVSNSDLTESVGVSPRLYALYLKDGLFRSTSHDALTLEIDGVRQLLDGLDVVNSCVRLFSHARRSSGAEGIAVEASVGGVPETQAMTTNMYVLLALTAEGREISVGSIVSLTAYLPGGVLFAFARLANSEPPLAVETTDRQRGRTPERNRTFSLTEHGWAELGVSIENLRELSAAARSGLHEIANHPATSADIRSAVIRNENHAFRSTRELFHYQDSGMEL